MSRGLKDVRRPIWVTIGSLWLGCISGVGTVARPTVLENQLLGAYQQLDKEWVQASSVRGVNQQGTLNYASLRAEALTHRAIQRFNEDDLDELKREGCLAESLRAELVVRSCAFVTHDMAIQKRRKRVAREENRARRAVLLWIAYETARQEGHNKPTDARLKELRAAYRRLLHDTAKPGYVLEVRPGVFREVKP